MFGLVAKRNGDNTQLFIMNTSALGILAKQVNWSEVRDCRKLIQSLKERGISQMCCFVILLLSNEMQMSVRLFSAIPHLRGQLGLTCVEIEV